MQLSPENAEEYIDYLRTVGRLDEAAVRLASVVNDESFVSKEGKSNYQVGCLYPMTSRTHLRYSHGLRGSILNTDI